MWQYVLLIFGQCFTKVLLPACLQRMRLTFWLLLTVLRGVSLWITNCVRFSQCGSSKRNQTFFSFNSKHSAINYQRITCAFSHGTEISILFHSFISWSDVFSNYSLSFLPPFFYSYIQHLPIFPAGLSLAKSTWYLKSERLLARSWPWHRTGSIFCMKRNTSGEKCLHLIETHS